jgi:hypothetical protein
LLWGTAEKHLRNAYGKIVNDHVREVFISNACEKAIPHGAMPENVFAPALLRRFSQCPHEPYSGSTKTARSDEHPESNSKKFTRN